MVDNTAWRTGIRCDCGDNYYAYVAYLNERVVKYNYLCKKCNRKGDWSQLARIYLERSRHQIEQEAMASEEFPEGYDGGGIPPFS
jgi:hypothetical protein